MLNLVDHVDFDGWLARQSREAAIAVATRAALRILPLTDNLRPDRFAAADERRFDDFLAELFIAGARHYAAAKYASPASPDVGVGGYHDVAFVAETVGSIRLDGAAAFAAGVVADAAAMLCVAFDGQPPVAETKRLWREISCDATRLARSSPASMIDARLWNFGPPAWAERAAAGLYGLLGRRAGWEVWLDWYRDRLHGVARSGAQDAAFAAAPMAVRAKGASSVNFYIRDCLASANGRATPPAVVAGVEPAQAYDGSNARRIYAAPGAPNLIGFALVGDDGVHQRLIEGARLVASRLIAALRPPCDFEAHGAYAEALGDYLEDLPAANGEGNIVLARDHARRLEAMLDAADAAPPPQIAVRLRALIANQTRLDAFYEDARRHDEAVARSNGATPFPLQAARTVAREVERSGAVFAANVETGLRRIERAVPAAAAQCGPDEAMRSLQRLWAASINSLWGTFLEGPKTFGAAPLWTDASERLAGPTAEVLGWLRASAA